MNLKKYILHIIILLFVFSCDNSDKPKKPDNLIAKEQMVNIMYDAFILNSAKGVNKRVLEKNGVFPEDYIFEKYNIDSTQFVLSNNYYAYDAKVYESIMNDIKKKINKENKIYKDLLAIEDAAKKKKKDSLAAVRKKRRDTTNKKLKKVKRPTLKPIKSKLKNNN